MRKLGVLTIVVLCLVATMGSTRGAQEAGKDKIQLEIAVFEGGYGIWPKEPADEYMKAHPNVTFNVWGNPRVWEQIRPRMISGDVPDILVPGWGFNHWPAIAEGQLMAFDDALETKSYDGTKTWKDTFLPGVITAWTYEGKTYGIPYFLNAFGWWYNEKAFADSGWKTAANWRELTGMFDKIKATGMAPMATCGLTPDYIIYAKWGILDYYIDRMGGTKVLEDAHNLKEGAWKHPAVLAAAAACKEIGDKYLMAGTLGLSHTESQQMFFMGKAAIVPVGTWLETESRDVIPADFVLRYMNPPAVSGGKGDPTSVHAQNDASSDFHIPTKTKNPKEAINFVKFMTSPETGKFITESKGSPLSTIGSEQYIKSAAVGSAFEFVKRAKYTWNTRAWESRYPTVQKQVNISLHDLMNGKITPQQFGDQVEAEAARVRKDPDTLWFPIQLQIEVASN